jgi:hypothetical protein
LKAYEKYHPAFNLGKSYLEGFGLSPETEDLILGVSFSVFFPHLSDVPVHSHQLLRVSPPFRFGKDIRRHRYFVDSNGYVGTISLLIDANLSLLFRVSEFEGIESQGAGSSSFFCLVNSFLTVRLCSVERP